MYSPNRFHFKSIPQCALKIYLIREVTILYICTYVAMHETISIFQAPREKRENHKKHKKDRKET